MFSSPAVVGVGGESGGVPSAKVPRDLEDFRAYINRGLEAQGIIAVWRPAGAPPVEPAAESAGARADAYARRVARAKDETSEINQYRRARELPELAPPVGSPRYSCHLRNPPSPTERDHRLPEELASCRPVEPPSCQKAPPLDRTEADWTPTTEFVPRPVRRRLYRLRDGLRCLSRPRIRACGYAIAPAPNGTAGSVGVLLDEEGQARFSGLIHCGSIWECPCCSLKIRAARAAEVTYAVETHGIKRCAMLTLTFRHDFEIGHDLAKARQALANIWRRVTRGEPWKRCRRRLGLWHSIRALDITYGAHNGWHPHLHVLLLLDHELPADELELYTDDKGARRWRWSPSGRNGLQWLRDRWGDMVEAELGVQARPDDVHGVDLSPCYKANYIAKLGLELSDPGHKQGRDKNRTPLQIAADFVAHGRRRDAALWKNYCAAMKGARFLTWSAGAKRALGIADRTDLELSDDEHTNATDRTVATIKSFAWCAIRGRVVDTPEGECAACYWILEQAEQGGRQAVERALLQVASGEVGRPERRRAAPKV